jgi:hypothetical protein
MGFFCSIARTPHAHPPADSRNGWSGSGRFQLKNFAAGDYLLRLVVRDELRKGKYAVAEQWVDLTVR